MGLPVFEDTFVQRALLGGMLFSLVASILSPWVVLRRLSYATDALAHATFGGIALGLFLGAGSLQSGDPAGLWKVLIISLVFSLSVSQLLACLMRFPFLSQDAATGIVYAGAFAVGGLFLALSPPDTTLGHGGVDSLLFGNILFLNSVEIWILAILGGLTLAGVWHQRRSLQLWAFDSDLAVAEGVRTDLLHFFLIGAVALVTVVTTKFMGLMMVMAFLVIPGSVGLMFGKSMKAIYWISWAFSTLSILIGLVLMEQWLPEVPPGSLTTATGFLLFIAAVIVRVQFGRKAVKKS